MSGFAVARVLALVLTFVAPHAHGRCLERITGPVVAESYRPVVFERDNWPTQRLLTHAAQILLRDQLGINSTSKDLGGGSALYARTADGGTTPNGADVNMEVWPNTKQSARSRWLCSDDSCRLTTERIIRAERCVRESLHAAMGQSNMRVKLRDPPSVAADQLLDFWRSYKTEQVLNSLPAADVAAEVMEQSCTKEYSLFRRRALLPVRVCWCRTWQSCPCQYILH